MKIESLEEIREASNGDVFVDKDGMVFHADDYGRLWCPGDSEVHWAEEVVLPALKVFRNSSQI